MRVQGQFGKTPVRYSVRLWPKRVSVSRSAMRRIMNKITSNEDDPEKIRKRFEDEMERERTKKYVKTHKTRLGRIFNKWRT